MKWSDVGLEEVNVVTIEWNPKRPSIKITKFFINPKLALAHVAAFKERYPNGLILLASSITKYGGFVAEQAVAQVLSITQKADDRDFGG